MIGRKMIRMMNDHLMYYYSQDEDEVEEEAFYIPKAFFENEKYRKMSVESISLYTVLMDRYNSSKKEGWIDEAGVPYVIFDRKDLAEILNLTPEAISRKIEELKKFGLLEEEKGLESKNKIYLLKYEEVK